MNLEKYALIFGLAIVVGVIVYSLSRPTTTGNVVEIPEKPDTQLQATQLSPILTGTTENGDVAIELVPKGFEEGILTVDISANTHSVDLSQFDLTKITTLKYGGKTAKPINAPQLSGHHVSGQMQFKLDKEPQEFEITIRGIPNVEERTFNWGGEK